MTVHQRLDGDILILTVDNPPVNALSAVERKGLVDGIERAKNEDVSAVIIIGSNDRFIAGADIKEFGKPPIPPHLPDVNNIIEACEKPVVAAISGAALGGGLEVALGCHGRIAHETAKLGLPEVTLGLVPGAGGTQRLPRLVGAPAALEMIVTGKPVSAPKAQTLGLVDATTRDALLSAAITFAKSCSINRLSERDVKHEDLNETAGALLKKTRGATAPKEAARLVSDAAMLPFSEGLAEERRTFLNLRGGPEAKALQHAFFAEKAAAKGPDDITGTAPREVSHVGVIGAGTMGAGIAMTYADAGFDVTLLEVSDEALETGLSRIASTYNSMAKKGRISEDQTDIRLARITGTTDYANLEDCDLIIEAAFESMAVKRDIFETLDKVAKPGAVLATNTSYLDINEIAAVTSRPADVVGMHYFSPANIMKLLEIVRGEKTARDVLATTLAMAKKTGKQAVVAGVCPGFIGNRMLRAYQREVGLMALEGAPFEDIDAALTSFGMAMGPFAVADLAGIDIGYKSRQDMAPGSYDVRPTLVHDRLAEAGHLGQKTEKGFYLYEGRKRLGPNPFAIEALIEARREIDLPQQSLTRDEMAARALQGLADEGAAIVRDAIAERPGDIDVVYINGYGFPRHKGGPMHWADVKKS